jgi:hypothetical protein
MIVPSMSYDEMRKEFLHDHHIAQVKSAHDYKRLLFDLHKRHQTHAVETVTWKSHLHNTWMSFYLFHEIGVNCLHVCITMDHGNLLKTLIGIEPTSTDIFIGEYNIHFFKR